MPDNIEITSGSGTTVATEDVSGIQHQKVKVEFGLDGVATMVSATNPLPVDGSGVTQPVSGTVTANLSATDNAVLDAIEIDTTSIDAKIPALGQALAASSVPVVLTAAQLSTLTPPAAITGFATETTLSLLNAKLVTGTDIGDVTINNSTGVAAVNIQDGGNTITVDNGGTFAVQAAATLAAETTKVIGTVNQGTSPWVTSNSTTSVVGNGAAATAQRVTLANDSTGIIATVGAVTSITNALPAGTNAIGKLAANSGVDIGDVDVTSISNGSLNGPGTPTIDSYTQASFNLTAAADQSLVAAPGASKQIWIYGIVFVLSAAGTVSFQDSDDTAITGIMPFAANSGLSSPPSGNFAMPLWKVATNKAFEVDLVTAEMDGSVSYAIVSV